MIFEKNIQVAYGETGINGKLKPVSIFNYLQDAASEHTGEMGVSAFDLYPRDLAWVVFRYRIRIFQYPRWKDRLRIRTWRYPLQNLYELREHEILDGDGRVVISSKSIWILIKLSTKKPMRLDKHLDPRLIEGCQKPIANDLDDLPETDPADLERTFGVRMHDLDFNRHVNNSIYAVWAMESVPPGILPALRPKEIAIHYLGETLYGDTVVARTREVASNPSRTFLHGIFSRGTGKELARLKTVWDCFD